MGAPIKVRENSAGKRKIIEEIPKLKSKLDQGGINVNDEPYGAKAGHSERLDGFSYIQILVCPAGQEAKESLCDQSAKADCNTDP